MSQDEIRARVETFTADIAGLIRRAAVDAVKEILNANAPTPRPHRRHFAAVGAAKSAPAPKRAPAIRGAKRAPGQKRDPKELAKLVDRLATHIAAKPGQRIEQIGQSLGLATKELSLPAKKLIAAKRIKTKGQKRSTQYFPAGS
jgi:hypothetical protein